MAPVYLKSVKRIDGLLAIYFFACMVQSLLERELRDAMKSQRVETLPLSPEGRPCPCPTTRQVLDLFEPFVRHTIIPADGGDFGVLHTELAPIHRRLLKLLKTPTTEDRA
ncbi:MAG: hypothetical protein AAF961_11355 [Planctomycetota bacterium]